MVKIYLLWWFMILHLPSICFKKCIWLLHPRFRSYSPVERITHPWSCLFEFPFLKGCSPYLIYLCVLVLIVWCYMKRYFVMGVLYVGTVSWNSCVRANQYSIDTVQYLVPVSCVKWNCGEMQVSKFYLWAGFSFKKNLKKCKQVKSPKHPQAINKNIFLRELSKWCFAWPCLSVRGICRPSIYIFLCTVDCGGNWKCLEQQIVTIWEQQHTTDVLL